jgi:hypothetical protein
VCSSPPSSYQRITNVSGVVLDQVPGSQVSVSPGAGVPVIDAPVAPSTGAAGTRTAPESALAAPEADVAVTRQEIARPASDEPRRYSFASAFSIGSPSRAR